MATAPNISVADLQYGTECKCKLMIADLGVAYRPKTPLQTVKDFQTAWNTLLPYVKGVKGVRLPSLNKGMLKVDGLYGAQTATAGDNFVDSPLPALASDMPTWAAQHQSSIVAMCPPASPPSPVPPQPTMPTTVSVSPTQAMAAPQVVQPQTTAAAAPVSTSPSGPSVVTVAVPTTPPPPEVTSTRTVVVTSPLPAPTPTTTPPPAPPPVNTKPPSIVSVQPTTVVVPPTTQLPETRITAPTAKGGSGVLAVAIGAVVIGGGIYLLSRSGKR